MDIHNNISQFYGQVLNDLKLIGVSSTFQILQNLGKVDRTADEIFDDHLNNFNRQQASANKLQKEFNNYIRCVRG